MTKEAQRMDQHKFLIDHIRHKQDIHLFEDNNDNVNYNNNQRKGKKRQVLRPCQRT